MAIFARSAFVGIFTPAIFIEERDPSCLVGCAQEPDICSGGLVAFEGVVVIGRVYGIGAERGKTLGKGDQPLVVLILAKERERV